MRTRSFIVIALSLLGVVQEGQAAKVLATRTEGTKNFGARSDISVPYLTTGSTPFMHGTFVMPRIYHAPMVDDPWLEDVRPVYNLPFWGGIIGFSSLATGAMPTGWAVTPRELSPAVRPNAAMPVGTTLNSRNHNQRNDGAKSPISR